MLKLNQWVWSSKIPNRIPFQPFELKIIVYLNNRNSNDSPKLQLQVLWLKCSKQIKISMTVWKVGKLFCTASKLNTWRRGLSFIWNSLMIPNLQWHLKAPEIKTDFVNNKLQSKLRQNHEVTLHHHQFLKHQVNQSLQF